MGRDTRALQKKQKEDKTCSDKVQDQHKVIKESGKNKKNKQERQTRKWKVENTEEKNRKIKIIIAIIIITTKHTHTNVQKDKKKSRGNIIEDRQRMKVEESKEGKQNTNKEI